jgi:hypothetical protein
MSGNTTGTTYEETLSRYTSNIVLQQLIESTYNVMCLPERARSLSVSLSLSLSLLQVAPPSRQLPAYCIYLRKYVTKYIIRPTGHSESLIPHVKPR